MGKGVVIKSTGSNYWVKTSDHSIVPCKIKGRFRIQGIRSTNPVAVGDCVHFTEGDDYGLIHKIEDRTNCIVRRATNLSKESHIIAANVSQACLIATINHPVTTSTFVDRFLASCEAYNVPVILVFNKIDLYGDADLMQLQEWMNMYESIGYTCLAVSAKNMQNMHELVAVLKDKTTLLAGHSGVGKSTLVNAIDSEVCIKTSPISEYHNSGKHTTTYSEMFELGNGGAIIDTPGIKGFGTFDLNPDEAYHHFPEIFKIAAQCAFHNCTHVHEPKCAVKDAVNDGSIAESRYMSYLSILGEDATQKYR